eukprot:1438845-Alexandrium_andersonii.AAC.1
MAGTPNPSLCLLQGPATPVEEWPTPTSPVAYGLNSPTASMCSDDAETTAAPTPEPEAAPLPP